MVIGGRDCIRIIHICYQCDVIFKSMRANKIEMNERISIGPDLPYSSHVENFVLNFIRFSFLLKWGLFWIGF